MKLRSVLVILIGFLLSGCLPPKPQITKRYNSITFKDQTHATGVPKAIISIFTIDVPKPPTSKRIFDLSGGGQAALIKGLAANLKGMPVSLFLSKVGARIGPQGGLPKDQNLTKLKRRVVLSVENTSHRPADRIQKLRIELATNNQVDFRNWNKGATAFEVIDLGKMSFTQERRTEASATIEPPQIKELASLGLEARTTKSLKEVVNLRRRIVDLNVAIVESKGGASNAVISRDGALDRDLAGNIIVDFEFSIKSSDLVRLSAIRNLFSEDRTPTKPS